MKIAVTGSSGFLGKFVVSSLQKRGFQVFPLSRQSKNWCCDLFDDSSLEYCFSNIKPEGLIHLAWVTEHGEYWNSVDNGKWSECSMKLMDVFRKNGGQRAIIAGTSAEYKWGSFKPLKENDELSYDSQYALNKNLLRAKALELASESGISLGWARYFCPFGQGEDDRRLLPKIAKKLSTNEEILFDSGRTIRDFMHVADVADATTEFFDSGVRGPVNICSGTGISIRELLTMVGDALGKTHLIKFDAVADDLNQPKYVVGDSYKLNTDVGWSMDTKNFKHRINEFCSSLSNMEGNGI